MKQIKLLGQVFLLIGIFACVRPADKTEQTSKPDDWKTMDEADFTIQYPDSLTLDKSGQLGTTFFLFFGQTSPTDSFKENINLMTQSLSGENIALDKFVEMSVEQINRFHTDGVIIENREVKNEDSEFQKLVYTATQGQYNLKYEQYYWIVNNKAYVLTFTCEASQFDNYKGVGEEIMNSFRIK